MVRRPAADCSALFMCNQPNKAQKSRWFHVLHGRTGQYFTIVTFRPFLRSVGPQPSTAVISAARLGVISKWANIRPSARIHHVIAPTVTPKGSSPCRLRSKMQVMPQPDSLSLLNTLLLNQVQQTALCYNSVDTVRWYRAAAHCSATTM
jgi:hypothetical protein